MQLVHGYHFDGHACKGHLAPCDLQHCDAKGVNVCFWVMSAREQTQGIHQILSKVSG